MLVALRGFVILVLDLIKVLTTLSQSANHLKLFIFVFLLYSANHLKRWRLVMATGRSNNKSIQLASRVPHEVVDAMESVKEIGESTGQFIVTAMRGEIKRRQRKPSKGSAKDSADD